MTHGPLALRLLPEPYAACKLPPETPLPPWANLDAATSLMAVSRTADELSLILDWRLVPADVPRQGPFRALVVQGPLPFDAVGILAALAAALAAAGIPLLAVSTYDTDYLLVKQELLDATMQALRDAGHAAQD